MSFEMLFLTAFSKRFSVVFVWLSSLRKVWWWTEFYIVCILPPNCTVWAWKCM